jgi:hypothetical protein
MNNTDFANKPLQNTNPYESRNENEAQTQNTLNIPKIELPKGGGAIKGIDEKFRINASNGTSSFSIPLPFSPTRGGPIPSVSLNYSSGSGNGVFGLGWSLDMPFIQRKTDKKLPEYKDEDENDIFMLAGSEDLIPAMKRNDDGTWVPEIPDTPPEFTVKRYRPRIEGNYSRIEKIKVGNSTYWRITTRDNITTIFGRSAAARIVDPADSAKIFKWLPEISYDDKGNCLEYEYLPEDMSGVKNCLHEQNRANGLAPFTNVYLQRIKYGNKNPYYPDKTQVYAPPPPIDPGYFFQAVFDYDDRDENIPEPESRKPWSCRHDPFSDYRPGFEIRTYRLCRRILFYHTFRELNLEHPKKPSLVKSLDLFYKHYKNPLSTTTERIEVDYIIKVQQTSYTLKADGTYAKKSLPAVEYSYSEPKWNTAVCGLPASNLPNAPAGLSKGYQWLDFYKEGISGIFSEQAEGWFYMENLGDGHFSPAEVISPKPSLQGFQDGFLSLNDLEADGRNFIISESEALKGYYEQDENGEWLPFRPFANLPNLKFKDPNTRFMDLNGDGKADIIISEDEVFTWYPSEGIKGYNSALYTRKPFNEEKGPTVVFAEAEQTIFLADMNGDGLTDIVRIRNGEVSYWPNLGFGRFGAKVAMSNSPDNFKTESLHLADISGTGAADILYLGNSSCQVWLNLSGNSFSSPLKIDPFPAVDSLNNIAVLDLFGSGTGCLVWSSSLPKYAEIPMCYINLLNSVKPYVLCGSNNGLGKVSTISYLSSTHFYLKDKKAGKPWITKLPFPVQCVSRVEIRETVTNTLFVTEYEYHHGYYDHLEGEFRGFGLVEQKDTEQYENFIRNSSNNIVDESLHQPPVLSKTWYHTGALLDRDVILSQFKNEYYQNPEFTEYHLPQARIETEDSYLLTTQDLTEALRACKSMVLRQEIYGQDGSELEKHPYSTAEHNCQIRMIQPVIAKAHAVFAVVESEAITFQYERNPRDPRISHSLNTVIDRYGNILESVSVVYPRKIPDLSLPAELRAEQGRLNITYTENSLTSIISEPYCYRLPLPCENKIWELGGKQPAEEYFTLTELKTAFTEALIRPYNQALEETVTQKRLIEHNRILYLKDDLSGALPFTEAGILGLTYESYHLAFTQDILDNIYTGRVDQSILVEGKYKLSQELRTAGLFPPSEPDDQWWIPSGIAGYPAEAAQHFYLPEKYIDPWGSETKIKYYADYHLLVEETEDMTGSITRVDNFDFRVLTPLSVRDLNDNITEVKLDLLGFVVGIANKGKGEEADDFAGFNSELSPAEIAAFFNDPVNCGPDLLHHASIRFVYDLSKLPVAIGSITRETHYRKALNQGTESKLQYKFEYCDGLGNTLMKKMQAEPGKAKKLDSEGNVVEVDTSPALRWVGNGRKVLNNKGNPVKHYEPYFSVTNLYESNRELVEIGVTPIMHYDATGRLLKTDNPEGTFSKSQFDAWLTKSYDANDTVNDSQWYTERMTGSLVTDSPEHEAAVKSALHYDTPTIVYLDSLGRNICTKVHNRYLDRHSGDIVNETHLTYTKLDIEGNRLFIRDARNNKVVEYKYSIDGKAGYMKNMDAGESWIISDVTGKPLYKWNSRNTMIHFKYDQLHRLLEIEVTE